MTTNHMRIRTHDMDSSVPKGKAILEMDNHGFVGTNNGWPMVGQPALFPQAQAEAIMTAWTYVQMFHPTLDEMPHPECVSDDAKKWLFGSIYNGTDIQE